MPDAIARLSDVLHDRYTIARELGAGGMATVYLAHDVKHDRDVAIKVLRPDLAAALGAERFLAEVKITARLDHPHILTLIDSGSVDATLFYVMPFVRGESLRTRLTREKQLGVDDARNIARQIASALDYAHRHGVIHRDIKPENILLHEGEATLTDFGIALAVNAADGVRLTGTGLSLGTPGYMSPEQAAGDRDVDARSDIYALGAVTYEMLAGEPPVTGATVQAMIAKLMTERPTSLRVLRHTVPAPVDAAVMRALAKVPSDRFATAREFADALTSEATVSTPAPPARAGRWTPFVLGGALLLIAFSGAYLIRQHAPAAGAAPNTAIRSIAVLPLDNYSADSTQEYFAEGMTDELTSDLATISQLRVTSRGSAMQFKGANRPATPVIAKALNVDAVVEGSVTRVGDEVRINAQLIDARVDRHIWAQTFERKSSDVLALQADMASAIASAINVQLTPREQSRFAAAPTVDPAAHDAYLKGRYFFNRPSDENLKKAMAQFDTAIALSPDFAPAYSGLSDTYAWAAFNEGFISAADAKPKAKKTAERAVALDSMSAEAHTSLGVYKAWFEYDWDGSEREFKRAIALNPNYAFAHDQLGLMLGIVGRFAEAITEGQRAMALDPLSPSILIDAAGIFEYSGDVSQARALDQKAEELDPNFFFPIHDEAAMALHANDFSEAIAKLQQARTMGAPPFVTAYLAYALGKSGDRAGAMATIAQLKQISPAGDVAPFNMALLYLGLGDHARALDDLERAYTESSQQLVWLNDEPIWNPLRSEPRFTALMKKLHFLK
jgi:serine/threonine-protein kinase